MIGRSVPLLGILLLTPALAGCVSVLDTGPTRVAVPAPTIGARYVYENGNGSRLVVTVNGTAERVDAVRRSWTVQRVSWRFDPTWSNHTFNFEEAVDPGTGLVVQRTALCRAPLALVWAGDRDGRRCETQPPAATVYFGGTGLPAGFGAAPLWNRTLTAGDRVQVPVHPNPVMWNRTTLAYTVDAVDAAQRDDCVKLASSAKDPTNVSTVSFAVIQGPFVVCPGQALPVRFTARFDRIGGMGHNASYRLVDVETGTEPIDLTVGGGQQPWRRSGRPFPRYRWSEPVVVDDGYQGVNLTVRAAHEVLMNRSDAYRSRIEAGARVLEARFTVGGYGRTGYGPVQSYTRRFVMDLTVDSPDRNVQLFRVRNTEESAAGQKAPHETYEVEEVSYLWSDPEPRVELADRLVATGPVAEWGGEVTGQPPVHYSKALDFQGATWGRGLNVTPERHRAYTLMLDFRAPPILLKDGAIGYSNPYTIQVDGASGALLRVDLPRSRLPLHRWVG